MVQRLNFRFEEPVSSYSNPFIDFRYSSVPEFRHSRSVTCKVHDAPYKLHYARLVQVV